LQYYKIVIQILDMCSYTRLEHIYPLG